MANFVLRLVLGAISGTLVCVIASLLCLFLISLLGLDRPWRGDGAVGMALLLILAWLIAGIFGAVGGVSSRTASSAAIGAGAAIPVVLVFGMWQIGALGSVPALGWPAAGAGGALAVRSLSNWWTRRTSR